MTKSERVERIDVERADDDESDVGGHDAEVAVSQVDQAHDAEDQREAGGEQGVETAQQDSLDDVVYPDHHHTPK